MSTRLNLEALTHFGTLVMLCLMLASSADAQTAKNSVGGVAGTGNGQIGKRQTSAEVLPNSEPLARIPTRLQNRIQNRIRNRIDTNFDSQPNVRSPFDAAGDQLKTNVRPRNR